MIRKFEIIELDAVMKIWLETNSTAHDFIDKSYWQGNYERVKEMLPNATIFVYESNNIIQGFIGLMGSYIAGIFVNAASQSKGVGKLLLEYVKENNAELSLQVYKKNARAITFYLREDFVISNEKMDEDTGELELEMNWSK
ncbi:GNAT family N-acetyltransferase [Paenibacillus yanchengensis]|uniref:GNAT family N-acetyltransferase n=1 Tax=Paenibacillus yanchengensis TaxID=2035833 RepID=A0ABW4YHV2_9BACL